MWKWGQVHFSRLAEFRRHEQRHRAIFGAELRRRGQRHCRSYWLCGLGGYLLGMLTGLFGRSAIAATTVAVESVVLRHLEQQLVALRGTDPAAAAAISAIISDEQHHHDQSATHLPAGRFWPRVLTPMVSASMRAVIWLGCGYERPDNCSSQSRGRLSVFSLL
jgi:ubiquinone biosynthesis monooxygenase Coq7